MTETVAAFDCGTNTVKLLIGALPDVAVRETRIVRLGQGVDATGELAPEALERTRVVLAAQSLAQGRGVNPLGDEVLDELGDWWAPGRCVDG